MVPDSTRVCWCIQILGRAGCMSLLDGTHYLDVTS
jgi:hypothetical protein